MAEPLDVPALLARKRDGGELEPHEISALLRAYLGGEVDDAQMSAWLMAGTIRGFTERETVALTEVLLASGARVDLDGLVGPTVDKHSTGGVGDTTTLIVAPLLAAAGCQVAKLSGRGLGHTGGTLDKLESIPGMRVDADVEQLRDQVERIGLAVAAATQDLVPADRRLYALRDVTATVDSPALIAASVMSKKLAGGAHHLLIDVKAGDGAFMRTYDEARMLARSCVALGRSQGRATAAAVTSMEEPLGAAVGNALEVAAAVEVLQGRRRGPLRELSIELAVLSLQLTGRSRHQAVEEITQIMAQGHGLEKFREWIAAQGGDARVADRPWNVLERAPVVREWKVEEGVVAAIGCRRIGRIAGGLGAGRRRQGDRVDASVGLELTVRVGDVVEKGQVGARIHARSADDAERAARELEHAVRIGSEPVTPLPLVLDVLGDIEAQGAVGRAAGSRSGLSRGSAGA
jgi:pyrimidine-nucleoside phosphorylase